MAEITIGIVDDATGAVLLDDELSIDKADVSDLLGDGAAMGCANPSEMREIKPMGTSQFTPIRISGYWHDSLVDGPGRRSVVRMQGCPIRCAGCWVPQTHDENGGYLAGVDQVAQALLDPAYERDGVTILGGEPFAQPDALATLLIFLIVDQAKHIVVYSGFPLERLQKRAESEVAIDIALSLIDMLIDGPYVQSRAHSDSCGCDDETRRFTGSCNQKVRRLH